MNTNSKLDQRPTSAIILAAGEAKRFGAAKQVLTWKGQTLLERAVQACLNAGCKQVLVVTGAHKETIELSLKPILRSDHVSLAHNPNWAEGMHTSIACGMKALLEMKLALQATFVLAVDQPLIDAPFLRKLFSAQKDADASALAYPSGPGVPACFGESLYDRLLKLTTQGGGAKAILRDPTVKTVTVNDPDKRRDIDTFADWNDFTQA